MRHDDDAAYIIHLLDPVAIIIAAHTFRLAHSSENTIAKKYTYNGPDGPEEIELIIHHFFTTDMLETPEHRAYKLLGKAWRWYRAYMEWEDKQIDNE